MAEVALAWVRVFCWGSEQVGKAGQGRAGQLLFKSNPFASEISCRAWQTGRREELKKGWSLWLALSRQIWPGQG